MFVKGGRIHYIYNFLGIPPKQRLVAPMPASGKHVIGVEFIKERIGERGEALGQRTLYVADSKPFRTQTGHYALCGEGLCVGCDGGDPVSGEYGAGFAFTGGRIVKVVFDIANDVYINVERELAAAMARD